MKINSWLFNWRQIRRLRRLKGFEYKMKVECDLIKSACILEIQNAIEPLLHTIEKLAIKLRIKTVQHIRTVTNRDMFDTQTLQPNPLFTQNQVVVIVGKYLLNLAVVGAFIVAESFLYHLTASLFLPNAPTYMKIAISIFLALLIMFALNYGIQQYFVYREVLEKYRGKENADVVIKQHRSKLMLGYILMVLSLTAIVFAGLARIAFLEFIPATGTGLSPEKLASIQRASDMGSIFTLIVTLITGLFMALLKQEQTKISEKYKVFRYWYKTHRRRNRYTQQLSHKANEVLLLIEQRVEKYWQLTIDLKKMFQVEYDEQFDQLNKEYQRLKAQRGFTVTDDIYNKFSVIRSSSEELFKYGVKNSVEIKGKVSLITDRLRMVEKLIAEQLPAAQPAGTGTAPVHPASEANGKLKQPDFKTL